MNLQTTTTTQPKLEQNLRTPHLPVIKVLGLGGGGSNAVDRMMALDIKDVEFMVANTDHQALMNSNAALKIQLGPEITRGLGAGGRPSVGEKAAQESYKELAAAMQGADMIFLTAGMGGGTGTGAISVAAEIARVQGIVTIAVVTTPFSFEMGTRQKNANEGLKKLQKHANTLITIPNDRLLYVAPQDLPIDTAFRLADDVLRQAVQSIVELVTEPGLINVDFAHIRRMMELGGGALMAIGHGSGEEKALKALQQALEHPLLESVSLSNAAGVIANFTASDQMSLVEVSNALVFLQSQASPETDIVMGTTENKHMDDRVQVNLIVTGLGASTLEEILPGSERIHNQPPPIVTPVLEPKKELQTAPLSFPLGATNLDIPAFLRRQSRFAG